MSIAMSVLSGILTAVVLSPALAVYTVATNGKMTRAYFGFHIAAIIYAICMGYSVAFSVIIAFVLMLMSTMMIDDLEDRLEFKLIPMLVAESILIIACGFKIAFTIILVTMIVQGIRSMIKEWVTS